MRAFSEVSFERGAIALVCERGSLQNTLCTALQGAIERLLYLPWVFGRVSISERQIASYGLENHRVLTGYIGGDFLLILSNLYFCGDERIASDY